MKELILPEELVIPSITTFYFQRFLRQRIQDCHVDAITFKNVWIRRFVLHQVLRSRRNGVINRVLMDFLGTMLSS
jgi:hypothetical protein